MLIAIGFITIVTAAITSTFVEAARRRADQATDAAEAETAGQTQAAITALAARLDAIDATLQTIVEQTRPV
jgi:type VI protein secretion system component VasK